MLLLGLDCAAGLGNHGGCPIRLRTLLFVMDRLRVKPEISPA
jgi:hypothetical protein